ncbi:MAG: hypothetical protein M9960_07790 [Xanthomonadaceae bacterium]|nr:hypothetical protein [Xanthomonadaceae bacterium]
MKHDHAFQRQRVGLPDALFESGAPVVRQELRVDESGAAAKAARRTEMSRHPGDAAVLSRHHEQHLLRRAHAAEGAFGEGVRVGKARRVGAFTPRRQGAGLLQRVGDRQHGHVFADPGRLPTLQMRLHLFGAAQALFDHPAAPRPDEQAARRVRITCLREPLQRIHLFDQRQRGFRHG